jgi:glyoxylase-like metal-dependent hydrolase (beta-lactamase superfamily II)
VLVDTFLTSEQAQTLADWVAASGKNLTAIYVTHGRGDHFFGLVPLLERFPRAKAIATPKIVEAMEQQLSPAWLDTGVSCFLGRGSADERALWRALVRDQIAFLPGAISVLYCIDATLFFSANRRPDMAQYPLKVWKLNLYQGSRRNRK